MLNSQLSASAPALFERPLVQSLRPRAASGFQITSFNSDGNKPRFIIKDQHEQNYVLTNHVGVKLIELIDGQRNVADLQQALEQRYGLSISTTKIEDFINLCNINNLLVPGSWIELDEQALKKEQRRRLRGRLGLYKQLFEGRWLLDVLVKQRRLWLNPLTVVTALIFMALGVVFLVAPPADAGLAAPLNQINLQPSDLVLTLLPLIFLVEISLHELAHALGCRLFGAKAGGFGFGLLWGVMPIFFTDTTDAYIIDNKYKRILISAVGPMVDLVFLGIFALICWQSSPDSGLYRFALAYTAFPLSTLLINLNPFLIRMDGYWILSDFVEEPNLRRSAFRYIRSSIRWLLRRPDPRDSLRETAQRGWRTHLLYLIYGVIALTWVLAFILSFFVAFAQAILRLVLMSGVI